MRCCVLSCLLLLSAESVQLRERVSTLEPGHDQDVDVLRSPASQQTDTISIGVEPSGAINVASDDIRWAARDLDSAGHLFPNHDTHWRHAFEIRHASEASHAASVATAAVRQLVAMGAFEAHTTDDVASMASATDGQRASLVDLHKLRRKRMVQIGQELARARGDAESPLQALRAAAEVLQNASVVESLLAEAAARVAEGADAAAAETSPGCGAAGGAADATESPARAQVRRYLTALEAALTAAAERHMREQLGDLWSPSTSESLDAAGAGSSADAAIDAGADFAGSVDGYSQESSLLELGAAADSARLRSRRKHHAADNSDGAAAAAASNSHGRSDGDDLGSFRRDAASGDWETMARRGNARIEAAEARRGRNAGARLAVMLLETQARAEELLGAGVATREIFACVVDQIMNMAPEIVLQIIMNGLVPQFIKLLMQLLMALLLDILVPSLSGVAMSVMGKLSTTPASQPCVCKGPDDTAYDPAGGIGYASFLSVGESAAVGSFSAAGPSFAAKIGAAAAAAAATVTPGSTSSAAAAASVGLGKPAAVMHDVPMTPGMRSVMHDVAAFLEAEGPAFGVHLPAYDFGLLSSRGSSGRSHSSTTVAGTGVRGQRMPFGRVGTPTQQDTGFGDAQPRQSSSVASATALGGTASFLEGAGAGLHASGQRTAGFFASSAAARSEGRSASAGAIGFAEVNGVRLQLVDFYPECPCRPGHMGYRYLQLDDAQPRLPLSPSDASVAAAAAARRHVQQDSPARAASMQATSLASPPAGGTALLEAHAASEPQPAAGHDSGSSVEANAAADDAIRAAATGLAWAPFETLAFLEREAGIPQLEQEQTAAGSPAGGDGFYADVAQAEAEGDATADASGDDARFAAEEAGQSSHEREAGRAGSGSRGRSRSDSRSGSKDTELDALAARGRTQMEIAAAMEAAQAAQADAFAASSAWLSDTVYDGSGGAGSSAEWAAALAAAGMDSGAGTGVGAGAGAGGGKTGKKKGPIAAIEPKVTEAVEAGLRDMALPRLLGLVAEGVKQRAGRTAPLAAHRAISRDAIQGITRRLTISLYRRTMLALAQPLVLRVVTRLTAQLTPALSLPLSLSLVHSLTHHPAADLFCEYCAALGDLPPLEDVVDITGEPKEVQQEAQRRGAYCTACQRTLAHDRAQDAHVAALHAKHAPRATAAVIERIPDITAKVLGVALPPAAASSPYKDAVLGAAIAGKKGKKK